MTPTSYLLEVRARSRARTGRAAEALSRELDRSLPIREFVMARPLLAVAISATTAAVATRFVSAPSRLLMRTARSLALHRLMSEFSPES